MADKFKVVKAKCSFCIRGSSLEESWLIPQVECINVATDIDLCEPCLRAAAERLDTGPPYDLKFGDDRECECGHIYYRHFDSYEDMKPVGCKYCGCDRFKEKADAGTPTG